MGLSASQARLLSITKRLSNNELESEIIAKNKMVLSARNTAASDKYIAALDTTKMEYVSYDDSGVVETVALTFNAINQYTPLKNQYNLYNAQGQVLVNSTDAANFANSNNLYEFLDCYGLFDRGFEEYQALLNQYNADMADYNNRMNEYNRELADYNREMADYMDEWNRHQAELADYNEKYAQYLRDYEEYVNELNAPKLYDEFTAAVLSNSHYNAAKSNDPGCFLHVLNNLLDYDGTVGGVNAPYNTSAKNPDGSIVQLTSLWENNYYNMTNLKNISDYMTLEENTYVCDGKDVGAPDGQNLYQVDRAAGTAPSIYSQLASDFIEIDNGDGTYSYQKKTLRQKTIDMYYLIANSVEQQNTRSSGSGEFTLTQGGVTVASFLTNFVEGDMKGLDPEEPTPPDPVDPFTLTEPTLDIAPPEKPEEPVYTSKIYDKPLAQWYTNLWYSMEGQDLSDEIYSVYDEQAEFDYFTVPNTPRTSKFSPAGEQLNQYYQVIDDRLAGDKSWLEFALNNGILTMKQAGLRSTGELTWAGIEFSSTSDIREVEDTTRIAKAEAEYKKTLLEIQAEDKKYDMELKKLDTEHSALKSEVDSIKNVMTKNIEKSFTAFS